MSTRAAIRPYLVAPDAPVDARLARSPLVVLSHGNWGTRHALGWLATRLVQAGYVVLSPEHLGTAADDQSAAGRVRLWERSLDVSHAIDALLRSPSWAPRVDPQRIGFVGYSFGGWTGASLAGALFDPQRQKAHCESAAAADAYCTSFRRDILANVSWEGAQRSYKDERVRAYYMLATGPGAGFTPASLRSISAPVVFETAIHDTVQEPGGNSSSMARQIPGATEIVRPFGHFTYAPECRPVVGPLLTRIAGLPICDDPPGVDRAQAHRLAADAVVRFLDRQLKTGELAPATAAAATALR